MKNRIAKHRTMRFATLLVLAAGVAGAEFLSACSSTSSFTVVADPGKYQYHSCKQLAGPRRRALKREQELKLLMDKAEQSTGGAVINVIAYQTDYVAAQEELKLIEARARAKNCDQNWPQEPEPNDRDASDANR
jgi:hypothetical protein